jgi:mannose-6-phosphate isomerase-like protein (cupin superfamily)
LRILLLLLLIASALPAQERKVDATWLHRYLPAVSAQPGALSSSSCHVKPLFGEGDAEGRILQTVTRFAEVTVDAHGSCQSALYDHEEEIYFTLQGEGNVHYGDEAYRLRANDFTYLPPGVKHSLENTSENAVRILVMTFKIPSSTPIQSPATHPKIINLDKVKEETVEGHPTSVQYKLLIGPRTGKRDAIDEAYVVNSFFWMNFAPGGTNSPHHHETAEEIYLVLKGAGEMVAGSGMDGVEGRYPAKEGDAYYFRPNATVGFYNQNKAGAQAHILAVRARIPLLKDED